MPNLNVASYIFTGQIGQTFSLDLALLSWVIDNLQDHFLWHVKVVEVEGHMCHVAGMSGSFFPSLLPKDFCCWLPFMQVCAGRISRPISALKEFMSKLKIVLFSKLFKTLEYVWELFRNPYPLLGSWNFNSDVNLRQIELAHLFPCYQVLSFTCSLCPDKQRRLPTYKR